MFSYHPVSDQLKSSPKIERTALSLLYCQADIRQRGRDCQRTHKEWDHPDCQTRIRQD